MPLSETKILFVPPSTISKRTKEQPLSKLLSISSFTISVKDGIDIFEVIWSIVFWSKRLSII